MILVVGATGYLGGEICRRLVSRGQLVKAVLRPTSDRARVDDLKRQGIAWVEADLKDRSSLELRGPDAGLCQRRLYRHDGDVAGVSRAPHVCQRLCRACDRRIGGDR